MTGSAALVVIHETTEDNLDGSPWPPDGNDFWSVVASQWLNDVAADHLRPTTSLSAVAGADDLEANQRAKEKRQ